MTRLSQILLIGSLFALVGVAVNAEAELGGRRFLPSALPSVKNGKAAIDSGCGVPISMMMGKQGLTGSIGQEPVNFMKRGSQYYGMFHGTTVNLHRSGSEDGGYVLSGIIDGQKVFLQINDNSVTGSLACQKQP